MSPETSRKLRFLAVGVASTGLYFGLLIALRPLIGSTILLTATCYAVSMCFNFLAQGLLTFQRTKLTGGQLGRYVVMQGSALVANSVLMALAVDHFGLPLVASQLVVTGFVTVFTYTMSKGWVFC